MCKQNHIPEVKDKYGACRECSRLKARAYYIKNKEKELARFKARYEANPEYFSKKLRKWQKKNPERTRFHASKRRAMIVHATPYWADLKEIERIYLSCPDGYEVDHIEPLKGRDVCGLHVPWNLQHLPASENRRKYNHQESN